MLHIFLIMIEEVCSEGFGCRMNLNVESYNCLFLANFSSDSKFLRRERVFALNNAGQCVDQNS